MVVVRWAASESKTTQIYPKVLGNPDRVKNEKEASIPMPDC